MSNKLLKKRRSAFASFLSGSRGDFRPYAGDGRDERLRRSSGVFTFRNIRPSWSKERMTSGESVRRQFDFEFAADHFIMHAQVHGFQRSCG
jgi:hypothetical protein